MRLAAEKISFSYGGSSVLEEISFELCSGQVLCVLGPNGAGKSTLIKCLANIHPPTSGRITIDSVDIKNILRKEFAKKLAYIPQNSMPAFPFAVKDIAVMGRNPYKNFFSEPNSNDYKIVENVLESLGISHLAEKNCTEISGGERQLVHFAAALVQEPQILILDEPTSHLDFGNQITVLKIIKKLASEGISIVMATHTPEHAFFAGTSACILQSGKITKWGKPSEIITEENINKAFSTEIKIITDKDGIKACVPTI